MGDSVASSQGEQLQGDPSLAVVPGADLQRAFHAGLDTLRMGQMASAASQFGNAFVGAEIALKMGVKRGMKEFTPQMQAHVRQYMWQCALHRAMALSAAADPADAVRTPEALQALHACVALAEELRDGEKVCESLDLLASLQLRLGQCADCVGTVAKLTKRAQKEGCVEVEMSGLLHQGMALAALGSPQQGAKALQRACDMAVQAGDAEAEMRAAGRLASVLAAAGDPRAAKQAAERAVVLAEQAGDVQELEALHDALAAQLAYVS